LISRRSITGNYSNSPRLSRNDPTATVKRHIRLLHEYNEIKDVGQGLMGLIAEGRGVRQIEVEREFGVGDKD
jgi:DNA repair protein Swi5/Sae3